MNTVEQEADKLLADLFAQEKARTDAVREANEKARRKYQIESMAFEKLRMQHLEECSKRDNKYAIFYLIFMPSRYYREQDQDNIIYKRLNDFYFCGHDLLKYDYNSDIIKIIHNNEWSKLTREYYDGWKHCNHWPELVKICPEKFKPYLERLRAML